MYIFGYIYYTYESDKTTEIDQWFSRINFENILVLKIIVVTKNDFIKSDLKKRSIFLPFDNPCNLELQSQGVQSKEVITEK